MLTERNAKFYFCNLASDVMRCISAQQENNDLRYHDSLLRARRTLGYLRKSGRPEAYEEGLLMLRALDLGRISDTLPSFKDHLTSLIASMV